MNSHESLQPTSVEDESLEHVNSLTTTSKKRTPPSIDTAQTFNKLILDKDQEPPKLLYSPLEDPNMEVPDQIPPIPPHRSTEETEMETRLLAAMANLISPLQTKLDQMQTSIESITKVDWDAQHETITRLVNDNTILSDKICQLEKTTCNL